MLSMRFKALLVVLTLTFAAMVMAPEVRAESYALTYEQAQSIICFDGAAWDCDHMTAIAYRESRFTPTAINYDCGADGSYALRCYGLLQLLSPCECGLLDPHENVRRAYHLYQNGGVAVHWSATQ